jgi:ElaB/YqjD/DUF883 family membrane-anchored ribosome-binding protein
MGILRRHPRDAADEVATVAMEETERIASDLSRYAPDVDSLLARMQSLPRGARDELERRMDAMRRGLDEAREAAVERAQFALDTTESYVRREPWTALAIVAAAGLVLGAVLARGMTSTRD